MERELWNELYRLVVASDNLPWRGLYRCWEIAVVYYWAVLHDRPVRWACDVKNWTLTPPRPLPAQSTVSRRLRSRHVKQLLTAVESQLRGDPAQWWAQRVDSKPLPVGSHSKDRQARWGRAGKAFAKGYKLHTIWGGAPLPSGWRIESMNVGDALAARRMLGELPGGGYIVGDKQYDSNPLHKTAAQAAFQIVAQQKRVGKQLGHRPHEPARLRSLELVQQPFGKALLRYRDEIERIFGTLTCTAAGLGPLPAWVRGLQRVHLWVQAKLTINALRILRQTRQPPLAVA